MSDTEKKKQKIAERLGFSEEEIKAKGIVGCAYDRHETNPLTPREVALVLEYRGAEEMGLASDRRCPREEVGKAISASHAYNWAAGFVYNMMVENRFAGFTEFAKKMEAEGVSPQDALLEFAKDAMTWLVPPDWAEGLDDWQVASINDGLRGIDAAIKAAKA